jgi:hypothetical protein
MLQKLTMPWYACEYLTYFVSNENTADIINRSFFNPNRQRPIARAARPANRVRLQCRGGSALLVRPTAHSGLGGGRPVDMI